MRVAGPAQARGCVNRSIPARRIVAMIAVTTAIMVAAPVISIVALAMQPAPDVWQHLIDYVLPLTIARYRAAARRRRRIVAPDRRRHRVGDLAA